VTSPSSMFIARTSTPSGWYEPCIELYDPVAPFDVTTAARTEPPTPKRTSLPSMFPPATPRSAEAVGGDALGGEPGHGAVPGVDGGLGVGGEGGGAAEAVGGDALGGEQPFLAGGVQLGQARLAEGGGRLVELGGTAVQERLQLAAEGFAVAGGEQAPQ